MTLGVSVAVSGPWGGTGQLQAVEDRIGDGVDLQLFRAWLYSVHLAQLIRSIATSEDIGSLLFAASRFPVLLGKASLLGKKSKGDGVRGKRGRCRQSRARSGLWRADREMLFSGSRVWCLFKVKGRWVLHEEA